MACQNCSQSYYKTAFYGPYPGCESLNTCSDCEKAIDSSCVVYTGPSLVNIEADSNICIETIFQKIDSKLAVVTGNYIEYDVYCLAPVVTQQDFVEKISLYVCETRSILSTFIENTFTTEIDNLQDQINEFTNPNITSCEAVGIVPTDVNQVVLQKLASNECNIYDMLDLSTANWNSCFTIVGTPPTTPLEATNALLQQICSIKNGQTGGILPVFDNSGTCLSGGTTSDSLQTTILLMRSRLCSTPILNINNLNFGCTSKPSNNDLDLQGTLQSILDKIDTLTKNSYQFDNNFVVSLIDPANQCLGKNVTLASGSGGSGSDRLVAVDVADTNPGTLIDKLNITGGLVGNVTDNIGKYTIKIDPSYIPQDIKVKAAVSDPTSGFLDEKIKATGNPSIGLTMGSSFDGVDNKVNIFANINPSTLAQAILEAIEDDSDLKAIFCSLVNSCPVLCSPPTNASITFQ